MTSASTPSGERRILARDAKGDEGEPPFDLEKVVLKFMDDHKEAIDSVLRDWGKGGKRRGWMIGAVMAFLGFIVLFTGILTAYSIISGEAFTFLVGAILMYLFNMIGPRLQVG